MKKTILLLVLVLFGLMGAFLEYGQNVKRTGPYLGEKPSGVKPEIFSPGFISTEAHEFSCCFSPDGNEFYFTRRDPRSNQTTVWFTRQVGGAWTPPEPEPALLTENFTFEPFITPDNQRLYFQTAGVAEGKPVMLTKYVERAAKGWGAVQDPGDTFNPMKTMHVSATKGGTIYTTDISAGPGSEALGIMRQVNGQYLKLERLGPPFNQTEKQQHPWVAPDESILIYTVRRPQQTPVSVLFASFRSKKGDWSKPVELKLGMNAGQPFVSSDGKFLFFTGGEQGKGDLYWVSTQILDDLHPKK